MPYETRHVLHVAEVKPGHYIGQLWQAHTPGDLPLTKEDLRGFPENEIAEARMETPSMVTKDVTQTIKEAFWLPPESKVHVLCMGGNPKGLLGIAAYALRVKFSGGDRQTLDELGLDPNETTAEKFYEVTGEWPLASVRTASVDTILVPTEYKNVIADVRSMQDEGWTIARIEQPWVKDTRELQQDVDEMLARQVRRKEEKRHSSGLGATRTKLMRFADVMWLPPPASPRHRRERW